MNKILIVAAIIIIGSGVLGMLSPQAKAADSPSFHHYQYGKCTMLKGEFNEAGQSVILAVCNMGKVYRFIQDVEEVKL
jgi:hypothetical protein